MADNEQEAIPVMEYLNTETLPRTLAAKYGVHATLSFYSSRLRDAVATADTMAKQNNPLAMAGQLSLIADYTKTINILVGNVDNIAAINNIKQ